VQRHLARTNNEQKVKNKREPKRAERLVSVNTGSFVGREAYGDGIPIVVLATSNIRS